MNEKLDSFNKDKVKCRMCKKYYEKSEGNSFKFPKLDGLPVDVHFCSFNCIKDFNLMPSLSWIFQESK
jgi:hypothetical protein